jgi:hypothetical protein
MQVFIIAWFTIRTDQINLKSLCFFIAEPKAPNYIEKSLMSKGASIKNFEDVNSFNIALDFVVTL